jgi:hypothetical protein
VLLLRSRMEGPASGRLGHGRREVAARHRDEGCRRLLLDTPAELMFPAVAGRKRGEVTLAMAGLTIVVHASRRLPCQGRPRRCPQAATPRRTAVRMRVGGRSAGCKRHQSPATPHRFGPSSRSSFRTHSRGIQWLADGYRLEVRQERTRSARIHIRITRFDNRDTPVA